MIGVLLKTLGKFAPGINALSYAYSAMEVVRYLKGDSINQPIPTVSQSSLTSPSGILGVVSTATGVYTTGKGIKEWWNGSSDKKEELIKKEIKQLHEKMAENKNEMKEGMKNVVERLESIEICMEEREILENMHRVCLGYFDRLVEIYPEKRALKDMRSTLCSTPHLTPRLAKVFEVLQISNIHDIDHFIDVVLYDKVCKAVGYSEGVKAIDFIKGP